MMRKLMRISCFFFFSHLNEFDSFFHCFFLYSFKQPRERSKIIIRHHDSQHIYNSDEEFFFSLTRKQLNKYCDISSLFRKTIGFSAGGAPISTGERDEGKRIQKYVELLMPLLFETWMEVRPAKLNATQASADFDEDDIFISNDAAFSLKIILEIIDQLLELVHMYNQNVTNDDLLESFRKKYGQEFCNQFLRGFPYHQGDGFKGTEKKREKTKNTFNIMNYINLLIFVQ